MPSDPCNEDALEKSESPEPFLSARGNHRAQPQQSSGGDLYGESVGQIPASPAEALGCLGRREEPFQQPRAIGGAQCIYFFDKVKTLKTHQQSKHQKHTIQI